MRNLSALNDSEVIREAQQGNRTAFDELVCRYDKQVLSLAARYVNQADEAKDIYQEVFLRVYKGLHKFQGTKRVRNMALPYYDQCLYHAWHKQKEARATDARSQD